MEVNHNSDARRFEIDLGGAFAFLEYRRSANSIVFTHTEVPPAFEGKGIGAKLVKAGLEWARGESAKVVPQCPFVATYIKRHPEFSDLTQ